MTDNPVIDNLTDRGRDNKCRGLCLYMPTSLFSIPTIC